jgi:hypothetical protein
MKTLIEILQSVARYAEAYAEIQSIQEESPLIPEGDQKTGCIGELYGYLYLAHANPGTTLTYGSHSEKGWDIECKSDRTSKRIQIKTVSAFSKTRTISPIHYGWDELFIIYLDRNLAPTGFWIITDTSIVAHGEVRKGCKCRDPEKAGTGSPTLPFGENRIADLHNAITAKKAA